MSDHISSQTMVTSDPYSRYAADVLGNDINVIFKILRDRAKIIIACMIMVTFVSVVIATQIQTTYTATAKLMMNATDAAIKRSDVFQRLFPAGVVNTTDVLSQIQIMKSPAVITQVILDNNLYKNPDFGGSTYYQSFDMMPKDKQQAMITKIILGLKITQEPGTSLVNISFEAKNPVDAATIANAVHVAYARNEQKRLKEQASRASEWLAERLEVLKEDVQKAEMVLENARQENNITWSFDNDIRIKQIDLLVRELSVVEANFAETQAILDMIDKAHVNKKRFNTVPEFLNEELAENLKLMEAELLRKRALYEKRYGANHPEMIALRAEFSAFRDKLNAEVNNFAESVKNQKDIQISKINEINKKIAKYRDSYKRDSEKRLRMRNLQTHAQTSRALLNTFMGYYLESMQNLNIDQIPLRVITPATVPTHSSAFHKGLVIPLGLITGFFFGVLIALLIERLEDSVQSASQLERLTQLSVYGIMPFVKMAKGQKPSAYIHANPAGILAELMRTLLTTIDIRNPRLKAGGRVLTVTSTHAAEGKTTNAIWLATTAAQAGKKVLIIDADMRRPALHKAFGIGNSRGLVDYLSNRLPLDETIYKKDDSHVHIMTSKAIPTHALTLLTNERMDTLIRRVRDDYDLVILDGPTARIFSDSLVCAQLSDQTLFVVEWKKTKRAEILETLKQFRGMNYKDISLILNKVNERKILKLRKQDLAYMDENKRV